MTPARWRQVEELFHAAVERAPEARQAFLHETCGEDAELRRQVELLLSNEAQAGSFLEKPAMDDSTVTQPPAGSLLGRKLGPYQIVSPLGAGGMGEVYRARDTTGTAKMAVEVKTNGAAFEPGVPQRLFEGPADNGWDVTPDGQRFLLGALQVRQNGQAPITVVLDWQAQLKK